MKLKFIFFALIFSSINSFSQQKYEYLGALNLNGNNKSNIAYKLVFTEDRGVITGYSITNLQGTHETKNIIQGTYNKKNYELKFKELDVVYTKSPLSDDVFCFVNFVGKARLSKEKNKIEGSFSGLFKNKSKCIDGKISLISVVDINKLLNKLAVKVKHSKKIKEELKAKVVSTLPNAIDSLKINSLTKNENINIFVDINEIKLIIWDDKIEDGDRINFFQNKKLILDNYMILNKKKMINLKLEPGTNIFMIEAINEGEKKLNTVSIILIANEKEFELSTNLKKSEKASISIIKKEN